MPPNYSYILSSAVVGCQSFFTETFHFIHVTIRVKLGFIGRQGSSDRSFYVSFTALRTDTCLERSYPFVFATNLLSDTAVKICIACVITLCSHWIKASSEKTRLV